MRDKTKVWCGWVVVGVLLMAGCAGMGSHRPPTGLPIRYENSECGLTLFLPAGWRGYSVLVQTWEGVDFSPALDEEVVVARGPMITLRHPEWRADAPHQDIPILVFTHAQWEALAEGKLWPSLYAGGVMEELWRNRQYVFAMSSRYNWGEAEGFKEVTDLLNRNCAVKKPPGPSN